MSSYRSLLVGLVAVLSLLAVARVDAGEVGDAREPGGDRIAVAAATDLKFALDEIVSAFSGARPGVTVSVAYGSSGSFFAQLERGAPFDLFLSADEEYARRLADAGYTLEATFRYAVGRIVLWTPRSSGLAVDRVGIAAVRDPTVRHIAIANPRHAPYGRAAEAALRSLGVYEAAADKLVIGENVAQAAQFVQSGAAEVGIIALSLALAPTMREQGTYWEVPQEAHPRLAQSGVILRGTGNAGGARAFREFLLGPAGRAILARYGFALP